MAHDCSTQQTPVKIHMYDSNIQIAMKVTK